MLSPELEHTLHRALALAAERRHKYATLEHLLLALIDDHDATPVLLACGVDITQIRQELSQFIDSELDSLKTAVVTDPKPTAGFQRVVQRSAIHVQSSGREEVTGANVLVALFSERESHAIYFLQLQDMTRLDAVNYINYGIAKVPGLSRRTDEKTDDIDDVNEPPHLTPPPSIPEPVMGLRLRITDAGTLDWRRTSNTQDDYDERIVNILLPRLRKVAQRAVSYFPQGGNAFASIQEDVTEYLEIVNRDINDISFPDLWAVGIQIQNALSAAKRDVEGLCSPELENEQISSLESLVAIHGLFISSTEEGKLLIETVQNYHRDEIDSQVYVRLATAFSDSVDASHDIFEAGVRHRFKKIHENISHNIESAKSIVTSENTTSNILAMVCSLTLFAGAAAAGGLIEGVMVESSTGKEIVEFGSQNIDAAVSLAARAIRLLSDNYTVLNAMASACPDMLSWISHFMNWLKTEMPSDFPQA